MVFRPSEPGERRGGRQKGTPNKTTTALKEAILEAAEEAGGEGGVVGYLTTLAKENNSAFASLLGKVLPMTVVGDGTDGAILHIHRIERKIIKHAQVETKA